MMNYKLAKWCWGIAVSLGLSACSMLDMQRSNHNHRDTYYEPVKPAHKVIVHKPRPVQKTYASKDSVQKATPGPVRKAAPQLPVIQ